MATQAEYAPDSGRNPEPTRRISSIVVGVDGSEHNKTAVEWAAHEADRSGRRLYVVTASGQFSAPVPHYSYGYVDTFDFGEHLTRVVQDVKDELQERYPTLDVRTLVRLGSASDALLGLADLADEMVVGKRGLGAIARILIGSTSIAVAGRSRVPVIVVPDDWTPPEHVRRPIVVGVDPERDHARPLEFAFARAEQWQVPVVVLHAADEEGLSGHLRSEEGSRSEISRRLIEATLAEHRASRPDVAVSVEQVRAVPAIGLLDAAIDSQLLVLGRTAPSERLGGFPFGSVGRAVLHYSETPVAIVPLQSG